LKLTFCRAIGYSGRLSDLPLAGVSMNSNLNHGDAHSLREAIPSWPPVMPEIEKSVRAALADGSWGQYHGRPIAELAESLKRQFGVQHTWPCSSGTVGVELALRGCGVRPGSEVILAGYDFPGNFRAIEAIGATPVLVDVRKNGWTIDPDALPKAYSEVTSAIVVSHLHGELADMRSIVAQCRAAGIAVVEDACQVPGAWVAGIVAGKWGDAAVLSFGGSKPLTAGRGGAVLTDNDDILQRIRITADRGNDAWPLSALQAAALIPQLDALDSFNKLRLANATRLRDAIRKTDGLFSTLDQLWDTDNSPVFYKFPLLVRDDNARDAAIGWLQSLGVPIDEGFRGFGLRSARRCRRVGELVNSQLAATQTMLIHHPVLLGSDALIDQVIGALEVAGACG
jgi:perosamine synthetase